MPLLFALFCQGGLLFRLIAQVAACHLACCAGVQQFCGDTFSLPHFAQENWLNAVP